MESINIGAVRRYSLAELEAIDFSTSDDFAIVVENMKKLIILKTNIEDLWEEEHELNLWQFVIDQESLVFLCYIIDQKLFTSFSIHCLPVSEFFYFIKATADKLYSKDYDKKIIYGTAKAPYFESLYELLYKVYFPMFVENTDWSKCIKTEYLQHQSKFLSQIFDLRNELIGQLVFYVPKDILDHDAVMIAEDKEFLNTVERTVMNWIWILMSMLMKRGHNEYGKNFGPFEEINFWEDRCCILKEALQQLSRNDVNKCIEVLKLGKSGCLPKVSAIQEQLINEMDVALENVKFLSILKKPCDLIKTSLLTDVPKHLALLLNSVKIIWNNSSYFSTNSEISSLLCKVNNFIIDASSKHIPLDKIFVEANFEKDDIIKGVMSCCNSWIHIFNVSEKVHKTYAAKYWSVESVVPLMSLFIHRCEELIKISEYKRQFKCDFEKNQYVKGHKCFEVAEQFRVIESYFQALLNNLAKYQNSCLDIHTTIWNDHFKKFSIEVHELELTVIKLMSNSLSHFAGIDEGIHILMMFKKYFEKEGFKKDLRKCIKSLYDVFFHEVSFVKKKLFESKRSNYPLLPTYGGMAFCLSQLPRRLKQQYKILKSTSHLWKKEYNVDIDNQYQQVMDAISESIHTLFLQWVKTIPKDPYSWMKNPMIIKKESSHFIQMNIESNIINLIEELHYWDKTGVEIPHQVLKLHEKSDVHLKRILRIMQCIKSYNRIASSLGENNMFNDSLAILEEFILPALLDLNWSSPQATLTTSLKGLAEYSKSVNDIFSSYEETKNKISNICKNIGKKCLFLCHIKSPLEFADFIQMQENYRKNILKEVQTLSKDILSMAKKLLNVYKKKRPEDLKFASHYMEMIGKSIDDSLVECFLTSLEAMTSLFGIHRKYKMRVVLKVSLTLKDNQLCFSPSFKELCFGIENLIENMANDLESVVKPEVTIFENAAFENKFKQALDGSELVKEARKEIDFGLYKLYEAQKNYKEEWKPFSSLWDTQKSVILKDYEQKGWKASCFEKDINQFMKIAGRITHIQRYQSLDFCVSDCNSLKKMAIICSEQWKKELGSVFSGILCLNLQNAYNLLDLTSKKFLIIPKTLEELRCCLKFLIDSKAYSLKIQLTFKSIHDIFSVLKKFDISIDEKVVEQEKYLDENWKNLKNSFNDYHIKLQKVQAMHHRYFLNYHDTLQKKSCTLLEYLHLNGPFQLKYGFTNALFKLLVFKKQLIYYKEKELWLNSDSKFFNIILDQLDILKCIENELNNLRIAWTYAKEIEDHILQWADISLLSFDVEKKRIISDDYKKLIVELKQRVEVSLKHLLRFWKSLHLFSLKPILAKGNYWILLDELLLKIQELEEYYAIILNIQEPTFQERHWNSLKNVLEISPSDTVEFFKTSSFSFNFLQNLKIDELKAKTNMIALQARKEFEIEQTLKKIENVWNTVTFDRMDYKTSYKLKETENVVAIVEEHQTTLGIMKASKYVSHFSKKIDSLENSLCLILDVIEQTELFQSKFFLLEKIFAEQTVQAQLPKEYVDFQEVTSSWNDVAVIIEKEKFAWKISHKEGFLQTLTDMNSKVQKVQKSLEAYLESKRRIFPRFYFISDDDLLSIIGQSSPMDIQPYLKKCFIGINQLEIIEITEEKKQHQKEVFIKASGMDSKCKEHVEFLNSVHLDGPVESWMLEIEEMMHTTLSSLLPKCLHSLHSSLSKEDFNFKEIKWLQNWPGQICLLSLQITWTAETTAVIKLVQESAVILPLKNLKKKWREILNQFIKKLASETEILMKLKSMMMITTVVHICDVIDYLIKCICNDPNAFEWLVQLRFFCDDDQEECIIQQTKTVLKYGFEYLGNRERLIITPLTERCFVSITAAFLLHQGVLMKGSKGCGKTETVQELGKTTGNYVLVINCSEGLTHVSLVRMLSGIAQIGAWGIFEEFNNVNVEILSILSQQISIIFQALSLKDDFFLFMGKENSLDEKCGIFLAVNTEYSNGSYKLPSSLSDVFRPVTMISPDILMIIEVYLTAYGLQDSKRLSRDVHLMFKLVEEQLSQQCHYDFGLRAVISFLKYVSNMKTVSSNTPETDIIVAALKSSILPKLFIDDHPLFEMLLDSLFGSMKTVTADVSHLQKSVEESLRQNSLQINANSILKVLEFHEMKTIYQAIILLGNSGSGKTTTWKTLKNTYSLLEISSLNEDTKVSAVHAYTFNPVSFSLHELFGHFNANGEWTDGLFSLTLRDACSNIRAKERWIVLNGPVEMEWTKNITSLLDGTKVLTLSNGERILLSEEVYLIIETTDLIHCSPTAISCCGIVYHQSNNIGWEIYFRSWLEKIENSVISSIIENLADKYLEDIIEFSFKYLETCKVISTSLINYIASFCKLMDSLLQDVLGEASINEKLSRIFWISLTWSMGSSIDERGQQLFNEFIHNLDESLPKSGSIYDYGLDENLEWIKWNNLLPLSWKLKEGIPLEMIIVPTKMTVAYQFIVKKLVCSMNPVFLVGKMHCGKTTVVKDLFLSLNPENYKHTILNISCQTTSTKLQKTVENQMVKKAGNIFLPEFGKKLVIFLDDVNLALVNKSHSVSCLELLNMELNCNYWFNRKSWKTNYLQNIVFVCAMTTQGSNGNNLSEPLLNSFNVINIIPPSELELKTIFVTLLLNKFNDPSLELRRLINSISLGNLNVYKTLTKYFLPTPSKLHYLFSMHNFKKAIFKLLEASPENINNKLFITKFWFHECLREFSDKLISEEDRSIFFQNLCDIARNEFVIQLNSLNVESKSAFVKFLNPAEGYVEIENIRELKKYFEDYVACYKRDNTNVEIVLFENSVEHLCRIIRGIEMSYGNMLLIGINGTGRKSLCRLAAYILKYQIFEIEMKKRYGNSEFRYDLRNLLYTCGVKKKDVMFLLSDFQIVHDEFLLYLTEILTSGEISDLYRQNDLEKIYAEIMEESESDIEKNECHKIFTENVKKHLHIVFCITYATPFYRKCIMNYPIIFKHTAVDLYEDWPRTALEYISKKLLENYYFEQPIGEENITCCQVLSEIHETMMKYSKDQKKTNMKLFHSSSTFITLVNTFKNVLTKRRNRVQQDMERLTLGLKKINETQEKVNEIAKETEEARAKLVIAEKECDEALIDIKAKKVIVADKQEAIQEKKLEIEKNEKICKKIAIAAQEDLNAALPALEKARKALEALNKRDIGEIKSYPKPPVLVEIVLEAVMILRNSEPSWAEAKRQLGNPSFLKELIEYDRDNISDSALAKVGKYIRKTEFQPDTIGKVSVAAKSLCIWVHAMYLYGEIYKKVKPKKERLRIAQEELDRLQKILAALLKELDELKAIIEQLEREHELLLKKKEEYARTARILALKLERAKNIMQGLSSEKERWTNKYLALSEKKKFVTGDSFLASGYLAYLGPHDPHIRIRTCNIWKRKITEKDIFFSADFYLADFFTDEAIMTEWTVCGLPKDQYSHEGAAIVTESYCCPFIIDPEGQAVKWLKNMEMKQGLKCCNIQDSKCTAILENCITEGYPVLLQMMNVQFDSILEPLLNNKTDETDLIIFNNKELKVHKNFHLYISTKSSNPVFPHAFMNLICIVNFTIKEKGLEDQLLPLVVRNERSDLEITKEKLVKSIRESKKQLLAIENTILKLLSESQGSLLDDESLVEALNQSKSTSLEVEDKLTSNEKTEAVIDAAREKYRPAALNAAILYFVLTDMVSINSIYVFNLDSYVALFLDSICKSPKDSDVNRRLKKLKLYHQYAVFKFACRSVSEQHSLLLSFHMCARILKGDGSLDKDEYEFFIHGGRVYDPTTDPPNPYSQWLPQKCWELLVQLDRLPKFIGITVSFDELSRNWQDWYLSAEPEKVFLPGNWRNVCNEFEKLLIIRCFRVDRITICVRNFILNNFGKRFLEYPHLSLTEIVKETETSKPIVLFMLSDDVDLEFIVAELAKKFGMSEKYRALSLGQGQGSIAAQLIVDAAKLGYWAFLFNCHLLVSWLPALEKIVDKLQLIRVNSEFRLFLGSAPTNSFPTSILQSGIVLTLDSPKGVRGNMLQLYKNDDLSKQPIKNALKYRSLLFSLSFFHSILLERKKFQNLGWNAIYHFTEADFKASVTMLQLYLNEYQDTPWDAFKNSILDVCYKNHITDERDINLLNTYYEQCFCDEVCSNGKYQLTSLESYYIPDDGPLDTYVKYIRILPSLDVAELFGQHSNAEIPYRIQEGESLLQHLSKIQGETFIQKEGIAEIQMIKIVEGLSQEIPNLIQEENSKDVLQDKLEPFNCVMVQEVKKYNKLLKLVKKSLDDLNEILLGKQKMTEKAEDFLKYIERFKVPPEWHLAYPSLKPLGSWMQDLNLRIQQFQEWSTSGISPIKFWLPGFTSPISILNAALITTAKTSDVMIKDLQWEYHVSTFDEAHIKEPPIEGIYVRGLFLEGAGWDKTNSMLIDPEPLHLITAMPVIHFKPVIESSMRGLYTCPCYYISKRVNKGDSTYLFSIDFKTKKPKEHWIKYGTAVVMSTND